ncbi:MAG: succinate dehydrogenase [Thermoplasmatota archaeon]
MSKSYINSSAKPVGSRSEVFSWYYMRISGLLLVSLALFHLWLNHIKHDVHDLNYDLVITRFEAWPILVVADFFLLTLGLSHGVNGIKGIIDDHVHDRNKRLAYITALWTVFAIFWVAGTAVLFTIQVN